MSYDYYLDRAETEEQRELLKHQAYCAYRPFRKVPCQCGAMMGSNERFRCLYCGLYLCQTCGEKHFGRTILEHEIEEDKKKEQQQWNEKMKNVAPWNRRTRTV